MVLSDGKNASLITTQRLENTLRLELLTEKSTKAGTEAITAETVSIQMSAKNNIKIKGKDFTTPTASTLITLESVLNQKSRRRPLLTEKPDSQTENKTEFTSTVNKVLTNKKSVKHRKTKNLTEIVLHRTTPENMTQHFKGYWSKLAEIEKLTSTLPPPTTMDPTSIPPLREWNEPEPTHDSLPEITDFPKLKSFNGKLIAIQRNDIIDDPFDESSVDPFNHDLPDNLVLLRQEKERSSKILRDLKQEQSSKKFMQNLVSHNNQKMLNNTDPLQNKTPSEFGTEFIYLKNRKTLGLSYHMSANILNTNGYYAVISANAIEPHTTIEYPFNLPISCMSWMSMGYGCFVILVYNNRAKTDQVYKVDEFIQSTMASWNMKMPGKVVILRIRVSTDSKFKRKPGHPYPEQVHTAQISRILVPKFLKYSVKEEHHKKLSNVYLITSDADIMPLSAQILYENSVSWNLISPLTTRLFSNSSLNQVYFALSCVGASAGTWDSLVTESEFGVTHFNDTGIKVLIKSEIEFQKTRPGSKKSDWYIDQALVSRWIKRYANKFGWDSLSIFYSKKPDTFMRVDRVSLESGDWDRVLDHELRNRYKDSHFCRKTFSGECWWKVHDLMRRHLDVEQMRVLKKYRAVFLNKMVKNRAIGTRNERNSVLEAEKMRREYLEKYEGVLDIRAEKTWLYPRVYKQGHRPKFVDWKHESLYKSKDDGSFIVVPKSEDIEVKLDDKLEKILL